MNYLIFVCYFCLFFLDIEAIPSVIPIDRFNLRTEGLEHSNTRQFFLVGSLQFGSLFQINYDATLQTLVPGSYTYGLFGSSGIRMVNDQIIHVANGVFPPTSNPLNGLEATYVQINFTSQTVINWINLTGIGSVGRQHAANDLDVDANGNVYITDSYGGQIWFVDTTTFQASTFVSSPLFNTVDPTAIGLNGILYHDDGYLIVSKSHSNGTNLAVLFRINITDRSVLQIPLAGNAPSGADGIIFDPSTQNIIYLASEGYVYTLSGENRWSSATVYYRVPVPSGCGTPTTITAVSEDNIYINCNQLDGYSSIRFIPLGTGHASVWWWWFLIILGLVLFACACMFPWWMRKCGYYRGQAPAPRVNKAHVELQETTEDSRSGRRRSTVDGIDQQRIS